MIFQYICPPAALYLAFSLIQILIDMFRGEINIAFLKFLVMIVFTIALNMLCTAGLGVISWLIVFIPFILMTYITTILVFVFGIPKTTDINPEQPDPRPDRKPRNEHNRDWWNNYKDGCAGTLFGCCDDGETTKKNLYGTNCSSYYPHSRHHSRHNKNLIGGCAGTRFGCCLTKKPQNTIVKELTVAVQRNTAVVIMEHQPNHVPTEHLLWSTLKNHWLQKNLLAAVQKKNMVAVLMEAPQWQKRVEFLIR